MVDLARSEKALWVGTLALLAALGVDAVLASPGHGTSAATPVSEGALVELQCTRLEQALVDAETTVRMLKALRRAPTLARSRR